jgi:hypothetical protein
MLTTQQIGGSSAGTNEVIPPTMAQISEAIAPLLKIDYSSSHQVLQALANIVHVISDLPDKISIRDTLDEFSIFPIPVPLIDHISEFIFCSWSNRQGKKAARDNIMEYYTTFMTAETSNVVKNFPAPEIKQDDSFKRLDDYLFKCHQRASQICQGRLIIFDGTSNVEKYLLFKHQVSQLITCTGDSHSHVNVEVLL